MRLRHGAMMMALLGLAACGDNNFDPRDKTAKYDPPTGELAMPYPCPDWSQSATTNYDHYTPINYVCDVNKYRALQVADPSDLYRGHGENLPDTEVTTGVITQYRAGKIPVALTPMQDTGNSSGGSSQ